MAVKDVAFSLVVGIAIVHGIDAGLVLAVGIYVHVHVGKLLAWLILVPASDTHRFLAVRYAESGGFQGVCQDIVNLELAQEQASRCDGFLHPFSHHTCRLGVQANAEFHFYPHILTWQASNPYAQGV